MQESLPHLKVDGDWSSLGYKLGSEFKESIQRTADECWRMTPNFQDYVRQSKPYLELTLRALPDYINMLDSLSETSKVPFPILFLLNTPEVIDFADLAEGYVIDNGHCSVLASPGKDGIRIAHTEDWSDKEKPRNLLAILRGRINGTGVLSLIYQGESPGTAVTINKHGLAICATQMETVTQVGVPRIAIATVATLCKRPAEVVALVQNNPQASGYGFVVAKGNEVWIIESAGRAVEVLKYSDRPVVHTNHPDFLPSSYVTRYAAGSLKRHERLTKLANTNMSIYDLMEVTRDTDDPHYPICRDATVAGAVVDLPTKTLWICPGKPNEGDYEKFTLSD